MPFGRVVACVLLGMLSACSKQASPVPTSPTSTASPAVAERQACSTLTLSMDQSVFGLAGGQSMLRIHAPSSDCSWTVSAVPQWLIGVPSSGTGSMDVPATVLAADAARFGQIRINSNFYVEIVQRPEQATGGPVLRCACYRVAPGGYNGAACIVSVAPPQNPANFGVFADLTSLGGPAVRSLLYAMTTGWTEWDLDIHAPATPGSYPISFFGIDAQGRVTAPVGCQWLVSGG